MKEKDFLMQATNNKINKVVITTKYLVFSINVFFLLLLSTSFLVWNISPIRSQYLAYLGLAFGVFLFVNFVFIIFWLIARNWIFLSFNLFVCIICYNPILSFFPLNIFRSNNPEADSFKVLSYNVRAFNWEIDKPWSENPTIQYLQNENADIICFQEYLASSDEKKSSSKKLSKVLHMPYYEVTPLRHVGSTVYGLAIFSKYPILDTQRIALETSDNGAVLYKINIQGKIVSLINNHLESNRLTSKDKELYLSVFKERKKEALGEVKHNLDDRLGKAYAKRAPQAKMIAQYVKNQTSDATLVCGDFNDTPISYTYRTICNANLIDSYKEDGFGPGITYHENYFFFRIDFILHTENMVATDFKIGKVKYSDHYPLRYIFL